MRRSSLHHSRPNRFQTHGRRAFSLTEMLLAVFILAIGVISISILFPVAIAQQQRSADDITGTVVAENAIALLRTKLRQEQFGWLNLDITSPDDPDFVTLPGDFRWRRPAFFLNDTVDANYGLIPAGSIDIFAGLGPDTVTEVPFNNAQFATPPVVIFPLRERFYPMQPDANDPARPRYVWDCAFRRFQGRIQVAIFVYRVSGTSGDQIDYRGVVNSADNTIPPLPFFRRFDGSGTAPNQNWPIGVTEIPGTEVGTAFNPSDPLQAWQVNNQYLLDHNGTVHRVVSGRRRQADGPVILQRPVPALPNIAVYDNQQPSGDAEVRMLWYVPPVMLDQNDRPVTLTPVYVTVREL